MLGNNESIPRIMIKQNPPMKNVWRVTVITIFLKSFNIFNSFLVGIITIEWIIHTIAYLLYQK